MAVGSVWREGRRVWLAIVVGSTLVAALGCDARSFRSSELDPPDGSVPVHRPDSGADVAIDVVPGATDVDLGPVEPFVRFDPITSPHAMDDVVGHDWGARLALSVATVGVSRVEYFVGDVYVGGSVDGPRFAVDAAFVTAGPRELLAIGLDAGGDEVGRDTATVEISGTTDPSCHAMLEVLGIAYEVLGTTLAIDDPVRIEPYVNGVSFRYVSNAAPTPMRMDCALAVRLHQLTEIVAPTGIDEIAHIGTHVYRCIGGGTPTTNPGCTLSNHSFGTAIDLAGFRNTATGEEYSVNDDWVITSGPTCPGTATELADARLHDYACAMWEEGAFQTILTPNYNADHRNHFHVDTGGAFIKTRPGEVWLEGIDPAGALHAH